ncbi:SHOCT domain-containing protein [Aeoliella sp. ICT_H6.2]|uniref:SHOCT domain-containing protein n=1 Tax=Aeoliella straminimaris TaxID=2954799 RepID=A0A9X2JF97_9BACT|nr:SHOCT domain-containing protein [Aeoliella straminimaris]MCO6043825.1 SHOCT domain-containing protein [Aeoliella straminimaris]
MKRRKISPERKALYYFGNAMMVVGGLLFASVFVTGMMNFGNFRDFDRRARNEGMRALAGMGLLIVGGVVSSIGAKGAAGSGLVLDPEKARQDVEPWSRMTGGVVSDALDEAGIDLSGRAGADELPFDEKLRRLHALFKDGILTAEEYEREKKELLDSN